MKTKFTKVTKGSVTGGWRRNRNARVSGIGDDETQVEPAVDDV
jgi:hypothetical protein